MIFDLDLETVVVSLRGIALRPEWIVAPGEMSVQETRDFHALRRAGWSFHHEDDLFWDKLRSQGFDGGAGEVGLLARRTADVQHGLVIVRNQLVVGLSNGKLVAILVQRYRHVKKLPFGSHLYEVDLLLPSHGQLLASMQREMDWICKAGGVNVLFVEPVLVYHIDPPETKSVRKITPFENLSALFKRLLALPKQPDLEQWHWKKIKLQEAWDEAATRGDGTLVAVIDVGFYDDDEFSPNVKKRVYVDEKGNDVTAQKPFPQDAHGTLCAGLVGATADDGRVNGAAPNCGLMLVALGETIDSTGMGAALGLCLKYRADVISCSVGPSKGSWDNLKTVTAAIDDLNRKGRGDLGTLVVWALPNNKKEIAPKLLESYDPLICVAASGEDDVPAPDSSYGQGLDLVAPGVGVLAILADENGSMVWKSDGASVAAPCVAGVAALVLSFKSKLTFAQLTEVMTNASCDPEMQNKHWDKFVGWGRLNALRAVRAAAKIAH